MIDFLVTDGSFASTDVSVKALSDRAKEFLGEMFGAGALSVTLPKSRGSEFARFAKAKGFIVQ